MAKDRLPSATAVISPRKDYPPQHPNFPIAYRLSLGRGVRFFGAFNDFLVA